uniref:Uncharacterized protein n=1 Tax=viral metagenome TaxID=1070528 RepID=A0A6C0K0T1_9ZZZZ
MIIIWSLLFGKGYREKGDNYHFFFQKKKIVYPMINKKTACKSLFIRVIGKQPLSRECMILIVSNSKKWPLLLSP